ncbi:hypothetical protein [Psychroserpens luteus]|uniref:Aminopeptidase FrvX n=1 Tax=Psychroserpens luteus TaxID=1434066 RepID=A0ABW5ZXY4_9FLAO|nr:hypothetical protein [Psychroserpens luteus]
MTKTDLIIKKTLEYLKYPSVVGYEQPFINKLEKDFKSLQLSTQRHSGLLSVKGNLPNSNIVSVHIDRHGLISNGKGELEYAAYRVKSQNTNSEIEPNKKMWEKIASRFENEKVYAYEPTTGKNIGSGRVEKCYICPVRNNFVFQVEELVHLKSGIPVSFSSHCGNSKKSIEGQLDNVINAALGFALFKFGFQGTLLLTEGEEIGESWSHIYNYFLDQKIETSRLIVLDTSPFEDDKSINMNSVILRSRDNNSEFEPVLTQTIREKCASLNIPFLVKDEYLTNSKKTTNIGNTELGHLISNSKNKISGTTVQIATMGYHSNKERANYEAIHNVFRILSETLI